MRSCPSASRARARLRPINSIDVGAMVPLSRAAPLSPSDAEGTAARVVAVRIGNPDLGQVDFQRFAPARPGEHSVLELETIGEVLALQRLLDIGREESE